MTIKTVDVFTLVNGIILVNFGLNRVHKISSLEHNFIIKKDIFHLIILEHFFKRHFYKKNCHIKYVTKYYLFSKTRSHIKLCRFAIHFIYFYFFLTWESEVQKNLDKYLILEYEVQKWQIQHVWSSYSIDNMFGKSYENVDVSQLHYSYHK